MSSFLSSTITKWFRRPRTSNVNGSGPVQNSDSSTEDETDDNIAPPAKRMRLASPNKVETKTTGTNTEPEACATISEADITSRSSFRPASVSTPLPSQPTIETIAKKEKDLEILNIQKRLSNVNEARSILRNALDEKPWHKKPNGKRLQSVSLLDNSRPYNKPAASGSLFYPGPTRYGGASSTYINQPNIKQKIDISLSGSPKTDEVDVSYATRRVMDVLQNYSSPITEAKRIAQLTQTANNLDNSITNNNAYKTQELYVPTMAKVLQLKKRIQLSHKSNAARQIYASHSSSQAFAPYATPIRQSTNPASNTESTSNLTTKMKTKITRTNRDVNRNHESDNSTPVHLPTAVLQIDNNNLPKFTFGNTAPPVASSGSITNGTATASSATKTDITTSTGIVPITAKTNKFMKTDIGNVTKIDSQAIDKSSPFKFSSPVMIDVETGDNSSLLPKYTFGSPDRQIKDKDKPANLANKTSKPAEQPTWKCNDCWVANKADSDKCVCCGGAKPSSANKTKYCSTCKIVSVPDNLEKCVDCEKKVDTANASVTKPNEQPKWKCPDCWVSNDKGQDKCVCCGAKRPQEKTPDAKSDVSEWKCDICWIKNKISDDKCAACGTPKATVQNKDKGLNKPNVSNSSNTFSDLKNITKSQKDKWECTICLARNEQNRACCACCEAERPDRIKDSAEKCFNFSKVQNTTFKFGIEPQAPKPSEKAETPSDPQVEPIAKDAEANNNVVPKPTFTFGVPNLQTKLGTIQEGNSKSSVVQEAKTAEETPKPKFTFGVNPIPSSKPAENKLFSSSTEAGVKSTPTNSVDEKCQEVPNIEEPVTQPQNTEKPVFGIPLKVPETSPSELTFGQVAQTVNNTPSVPSITTTENAKVAEPTFSFSASNIKTGFQLLPTSATPDPVIAATQATTSMSFFQKSDPVTSSINFFSKPEPTTSSLQLFNKTETTTTVTSSVSSTPVFSFGASNTVTQPEKPKFNFSFGKSEPSNQPSLFSLQPSNTLSGLSSGTANTSGLQAGTVNTLTSNTLPTGVLAGTDQNVNNLPAIPTGNPFSIQTNKTWPLNQNKIGSQLPENKDSASTGIFGATEKKDNMWSLNSSSNMFTANGSANNSPNMFGSSTNNTQKPNFSFGSGIPFNSTPNNATTTNFGSSQTTPNIFGLSNNTQPDMFSSSIQNSTPNLFGAQANNNAPSGMFGSLSAPSFGRTASVPSFEAAPAPLNPVPAPSFNFGAQQVPGVFGFGQQQQSQTQAVPGVYNFGAQASSTAPRRFNIGSAGASPSATGRRDRPIRRAVRRTFQQ